MERAKAELIGEIIALLGGVSIPAAATALPEMSFLHTVSYSRIKDVWSAGALISEACDQEVENLRLVLEASGDVAATLSRIVEFGNVSNKYKGTGGYSFFRKVSPEHIALIRRYLGDDFIASNANLKKRNLRPKAVG